MANPKKNALGRGLSALLENTGTDVTTRKDSDALVAGSIGNIPVDKIEANPFLPRTKNKKKALLELATSIKEHGLIQPVTVRKLGYDKYQLISGERRFRASQAAGLTSIPAYVRIANDQEMLEMAIIENIQRENLNAIEVALGYKRLIDEVGLSQEELGERIGKDRTTVTNYLRLLKLPDAVQAGIRDKKISMGHARAILGIVNEQSMMDVFRQTVDDDLSVRQVEELARLYNEGEYVTRRVKKGGKVKAIHNPADVETLNRLRERFNKKVLMTKNIRGKGKIVIPFKNQEEFNEIIARLGI